MPVEVVSFMFSEENLRKRLQFQLIFQCAPFLKGLKAACMVNIEPGHCRELEEILAGTDMEYMVLSENKGRVLVFLYRENALSVYLGQEEVREFLRHYGYTFCNLKMVLRRLSERVRRYASHNKGFPHEIGVFLDYPVEDVRCFIEQGGKGEVMSGYWKVYHNPGRAKMTFLAYDKARVSAVNEYLAGRTFREIADPFLESYEMDKELGFLHI